MLQFLTGFANVLMIVTCIFLICLVLIQRGKGGGLAGAFGGVGGSSAFGTKAGDVFTRVTIGAAFFWFVLALFLVYASNIKPGSAFEKGAPANKGTLTGEKDKGGAKGTGSTAPEKETSEIVLPPATGSTVPPTGGPATKPATDKSAPPLNPAEAGMQPFTNPPTTTPPKPKP